MLMKLFHAEKKKHTVHFALTEIALGTYHVHKVLIVFTSGYFYWGVDSFHFRVDSP